jgi:hypothetical protein
MFYNQSKILEKATEMRSPVPRWIPLRLVRIGSCRIGHGRGCHACIEGQRLLGIVLSSAAKRLVLTPGRHQTLYSQIIAPSFGFQGWMGRVCPTESGAWNLLWGEGCRCRPPPTAPRYLWGEGCRPAPTPASRDYFGAPRLKLPFPGGRGKELVLQAVTAGGWSF